MGRVPGRVVRVDRGFPLIATGTQFVRAEHATELIKTATSLAVVGDWVALAPARGHEMAIIEDILPRTGSFSRSDPGEQTGMQTLAANIDVVFVVQSLSGRSVNVRRLEREMALVWGSGATPVIVLTKSDLVDDLDAILADVAEAAPGVDVIVESAVTGEGVEDIRARIPRGTTAVLLGGSGVGKSTLVNRLVGTEIQETGEVRAVDDKGRHTTVAREMVFLPDGGIIIDTPGMRGLALWDSEGLSSAFPDIMGFAAHCKFRDCTHTDEPGCAVLAAVESGDLPARRLESYRDLVGELETLAARQEVRARLEKKREEQTLGRIKRRYQNNPHKRGRSQ